MGKLLLYIATTCLMILGFALLVQNFGWTWAGHRLMTVDSLKLEVNLGFLVAVALGLLNARIFYGKK